MNGPQPLVLIVDDNPTNIDLLVNTLKGEYRLGIAKKGTSALEYAAKYHPDLILLDIMMPEMDGYATMQVIRQNPAFRRLPIVALTAKAMKGDREKCLEAGASEYLAKPVNTEQLLSALRMWLHR